MSYIPFNTEHQSNYSDICIDENEQRVLDEERYRNNQFKQLKIQQIVNDYNLEKLKLNYLGTFTFYYDRIRDELYKVDSICIEHDPIFQNVSDGENHNIRLVNNIKK